MRQRPFGKTGLTTPELMLGGGFVGGIMINSDEDTRRTALNKVLDAGSDWIDTATSYGNGQSETNIGRLLQEMPKGTPSARFQQDRPDPEDLKDPKSAVRKALEASLGTAANGQAGAVSAAQSHRLERLPGPRLVHAL